MTLPLDSRLIYTLADIGPRRLQRRLRYSIRQRLDRWLPPFMAAFWAGANSSTPHWQQNLRHLELQFSQLPETVEPETVSFRFLQIEKQMTWPICWIDSHWPRLWQFHLHYFDWARDWLELRLINGQWPNEAASLEPLLDHWIKANPPGRGDGWHSYTLSLRVRNWVWLFCSCPHLATPFRVNSLWQQLRWLQSHPEHCHGGNHWLENLTSLAVGSLQFAGSDAKSMHRRAMRLLEKELSSQVLADGGHEERSASYHLLMLDRLVELGCCLAATQDERPSWLVGAIEAMAGWAMSVRLEGGSAPRFNDSAVDAAPPLDQVISFAYGYLQRRLGASGFRRLLLQGVASESIPLSLVLNPSVSIPPVVTDLPVTGWTILRPGYGWELVFKCGTPCPPHLPPHVHSDQLSVELSCRGQLLLSEAGTSIYGYCPERAYERSGAAHNVLQLGLSLPSGEIEWIEPVEVWGCFRAARKAQPRHRLNGVLSDETCVVAGSHDGFDRFGASHERRVELSDATPDQLILTIEDAVSTCRTLYFRQWWHLAPDISKGFMNHLSFEASTAEGIHRSWHDTWFSEGFGKRIPRFSLCISGSLPPGEHKLLIVLPVSASLPPVSVSPCPASG